MCHVVWVRVSAHLFEGNKSSQGAFGQAGAAQVDLTFAYDFGLHVCETVEARTRDEDEVVLELWT